MFEYGFCCFHRSQSIKANLCFSFFTFHSYILQELGHGDLVANVSTTTTWHFHEENILKIFSLNSYPRTKLYLDSVMQ